MVAFQRPNSKPSSVGGSSVCQASGRSQRRMVSKGGRRLYLAVDNTRRGAGGPAAIGSASPVEREPTQPPAMAHRAGGATALVAPAPDGGLLMDLEVTARHWLQWMHNSLRRSGLVGQLAGSGPAVALALALVFGGLLSVRLVQGGPPSELAGQSASSSAAPAVATLGAGDGVITVQAGDSLWSIADDRFPNHDPRQVVDALVAANGTSVIQVGQQVIVPATLLESGTLLD